MSFRFIGFNSQLPSDNLGEPGPSAKIWVRRWGVTSERQPVG